MLPTCLAAARIAAHNLENTLGLASQISYVDGYSQDASVQIALNYGARVFLQHPDYPTSACGRQSGLMLTNGDLIMFLDADCEISPGWLVEGAQFLQSHPGAYGVYGQVSYIRSLGRQNVFFENYGQVTRVEPARGRYTGSGSLLVRRSAAEAVGGYQPDIMPLDDVYFICTLQRAGFEIYRVPVFMEYHRDRHVRSVGAAVKKFRFGILGSALRVGSVVRKAIMDRKFARLFLPYLRAEWRFAGILFLLGGLAIASGFFPAIAYRIWMLNGLIFAIWLYGQVRRRRNVLLGMANVAAMSVNLAGIMLALLVGDHYVRWDAQHSPEFLEELQAANRAARPDTMLVTRD